MDIIPQEAAVGSNNEIIYLLNRERLFEFNQNSGKVFLLLGCESLDCVGVSYFKEFPSAPGNKTTIYWQSFYVDEDTIYLAVFSQLYLFKRKDGMITILSDKEYAKNWNSKDGMLLKDTVFREIRSLTKDPSGNLYICDFITIFKVGSDGILQQLTSTNGNSFEKHDGYAINTTLTNGASFITYRNGFLYGYDTFTIFKINLETSWFTVISGKSLYLPTSEYAIDNIIYANGLAFLPDDSILTLERNYFNFKMINQTTGILKTLSKLENTLISNPKVFGNDLLINDNKVFKINWTTGKLSPILDHRGPVGDGTLLEYRRFKSISTIAFNESSGELYIADTSLENTLQKIDTLNRVTYVPISFSNISCWNSSIETRLDILYNPVSLHVKDSSLFLANTGIQSSIQKFDLSKEGSNCFYAGSISSDRLLTKSDSFSSILNNPNGIHCSKYFKKDIYIADTDNHRILRANIYDETETIVGNGIQGFSGDGGLAVNAQLDRPHSVYYEQSTRTLYIADSGNHRIRYVDMNTGIISTLFGNGIPGFNGDELDPLETQLNFPKYIVNYPAWGLFISDSNNHRVRRFNNTITTILGTGNSGFKIVANSPRSTEISSPFGLFFDSRRLYGLYVADSFNHRILLVSMDGPISVSIIAGTNSGGYNGDGMNPTQAKLFLPSSVSLYGDKIVIADTYNNRIRMIEDGIISTIIIPVTTNDLYSQITMPMGICESFALFVSSGNEILSISSRTMETTKTVGGVGDGLHVFNADVKPSKIIVYPDNRMIISEANSNRIRLVDNYGKISTIAGNGKFGYGGDSGYARDATLAAPTGISFSPDYQTLFIADSSNNRIRKLVDGKIYLVAGTGGSGDSSFNPDPLQSQFKNPRLLATLTNGDVVIGDTLNKQIKIISYKDGTIRQIASDTAATDMVSTRNNTLYITTNDMIFKAIPTCETGFQLVNDNTECVPICHGKFGNDACSLRGECISPENCTCWDRLFIGKECEIPMCFGIAANDPIVCSYSNGTCELNNKCKCREGFIGEKCENPICFAQIIGESCGGTLRGTCINKDKCFCNEYFTGERCEFRICSGRSENDSQVCNAHGKCVEYGRCVCETLYSGLDCSDISQIYALGIAGSIIVFILIISVLVSGILGFTIYRKQRKERKILETELSLDERLLTSTEDEELHFPSTTSVHANSRVVEDASSFVIPLHKIGMDKPIKRLGEGGMGSVFMTKFNGMTVAVKVFDLNNLNISEEDFKNEAIVLSKLRHPNIINFYGISTSPTKRYIIMECLDQSLENLIAKIERKQVSYSLDQKLRMMLNIANGIEYLHTLKPRRIIHRDLKTANILLDSNGNCKLCDFGLSKSISQTTVSALTNQLGTHYYMSPELFDIKPIDPSFATSVDIYSFSIIMWQILFEIKDPYLSKSPEILKKLRMTSNNEQITSYQLTKMICERNHRPVIPFNSIDSCRDWFLEFMPSDKQDESLQIFALSQLIQQCWQADTKLRPNIEQLIQQLEAILSNLSSP